MKKITVLLLSSLLGFLTFAVSADEIPMETLSNSNAIGTRVDVPSPVSSMNQKVKLPAITSVSALPPVSDGNTQALKNEVHNLQALVSQQTRQINMLKQQLDSSYQKLNHRLEKRQQRAKLVMAAPTPAAEQQFSTNNNAQSADSELQAYQTAFGLVTKRDYPHAITKLNDYLFAYPNGKYAANCHYWLGEIYYNNMKFNKAESEFLIVIGQYSKSSKVADANYKLAMIDLARGNDGNAKVKLGALIKKYPNSAAAALAKQQLQKI
ncbi:MAG: tol-pal system protein YbgF [Gammaproteobacteria bacterium]|nr:tol-pal system protein YbgF [Gammaproteobacteria bacterium]